MFYEVAGWERPHWYESNAALVERYGVQPREAEWDARWWSPIINAEHLAMREHAGLFDLSAFRDLRRPRAGRARRAPAQRARADGRPGRTRRLHAGARARRRLPLRPHDHAARRRRVPDRHGRGAWMADRKLFVTSCRTTARRRSSTSRPAGRRSASGAAGAGHHLRRHLRRRVARGLPVRDVPDRRDRVPARARVADLVRATSGGSCTSRSSRAPGSGTSSGGGQPHGLTACGIGVYGTTGRLEKCYRAFAAELESEYTVVEAACSGRRSRTRTSSARRRICAIARRSRPRSSAR